MTTPYQIVATNLIAYLPPHACALHLSHNAHRGYYETVGEYLADAGATDDQISPEERERAEKTDELWELQWYPDNAVGSYKLYAATLETLLEVVKGRKS